MQQRFFINMDEKLYISSFIRLVDAKLQLNEKTLMHEDNSITFKEISKKIYKQFELKYIKFFKMDEHSKLGFLPASILLNNLNLDYEPDKVAMIMFNAESTMHTDNNYVTTLDTIPSPAVFVYTLPNIVIGEICIKFKLRGENTFFIEKDFNADSIFQMVDILFKTSNTRACLTGWVNFKSQQDYNCTLYLVERVVEQQNYIIFEPKNIDKIYRGELK